MKPARRAAIRRSRELELQRERVNMSHMQLLYGRGTVAEDGSFAGLFGASPGQESAAQLERPQGEAKCGDPTSEAQSPLRRN